MSWERALPRLFLAASFLLSVGSLALFGARNLDSDMASEMMLARLLNDEGRLLTDSWYYSTELRVISAVPAFQLGLLVFPGDWHAARVLGVALLEALTAASFLWMAKGLGMGDGALYAAAALLAPFGPVYENLFLFGGYYAGFSAVGFLLTGLALRPAGGKARMAALALLGLYAGLAGVRMPMMLGAPLFAVCAAEAAGALWRGALPGRAAEGGALRALSRACALALCMLAGYLVNSRVLSRLYAFASFDGAQLAEIDPARFLDQLGYWLQFFGYRRGGTLLSLRGAVSAAGICLALALPALAARALGNRAWTTPPQRTFARLAFACVALGMAVNALTEKGTESAAYSPSYYMLGIQLIIACAFLALERMPCGSRGARTVAMCALCGVFLCQGAVSARDASLSAPHYEETLSLLREQGYTQGYATFWEGNVLTEASDGEIEVWVLESYRSGKLYPWLQRKDHLLREPEGKVFAVASPTDARPRSFEPYVLGDFEGSRVYGFESTQAFKEALEEATREDAYWWSEYCG